MSRILFGVVLVSLAIGGCAKRTSAVGTWASSGPLVEVPGGMVDRLVVPDEGGWSGLLGRAARVLEREVVSTIEGAEVRATLRAGGDVELMMRVPVLGGYEERAVDEVTARWEAGDREGEVFFTVTEIAGGERRLLRGEVDGNELRVFVVGGEEMLFERVR